MEESRLWSHPGYGEAHTRVARQPNVHFRPVDVADALVESVHFQVTMSTVAQFARTSRCRGLQALSDSDDAQTFPLTLPNDGVIID